MERNCNSSFLQMKKDNLKQRYAHKIIWNLANIYEEKDYHLQPIHLQKNNNKTNELLHY